MRVIVCGGRDFQNGALLNRELDRLHSERPFTAFMQGGARGADRLAKFWARTKPELDGARYECKADWKKLGNAAGPVRNRRMLEWNPDLVVAFPTGGPGTQDMMTIARTAGVEVIMIMEGDPFEVGV